jgi:hypothetical protein
MRALAFNSEFLSQNKSWSKESSEVSRVSFSRCDSERARNTERPTQETRTMRHIEKNECKPLTSHRVVLLYRMYTYLCLLLTKKGKRNSKHNAIAQAYKKHMQSLYQVVSSS